MVGPDAHASGTLVWVGDLSATLTSGSRGRHMATVISLRALSIGLYRREGDAGFGCWRPLTQCGQTPRLARPKQQRFSVLGGLLGAVILSVQGSTLLQKLQHRPHHDRQQLWRSVVAAGQVDLGPGAVDGRGVQRELGAEPVGG